MHTPTTKESPRDDTPDVLTGVLRSSMLGTIVILTGLLASGILPQPTQVIAGLDSILAAVGTGIVIAGSFIGRSLRARSPGVAPFLVQCAISEAGGICGFLTGVLTGNMMIAYVLLGIGAAGIVLTPAPPQVLPRHGHDQRRVDGTESQPR